MTKKASLVFQNEFVYRPVMETVACLEAPNWHWMASDVVYENNTNYLAVLSQRKCIES